ncbi:MAG: hypothetical protein OEV55_01335 [candidate division Zixibacteria bacterium]|nr:hypothetical protein [candidate division Zixibacteria bacterium]
MSFLEKLLAIDRRIIFLFIAIAAALPLFFTVKLHIEVTPIVNNVYNALEALPPGSKVLLSMDYDPGSMPELQPMAESFLRYCFLRDLKVIIIGLWPNGPIQANIALEEVFKDEEVKNRNPQYGIDYVNLGYTVGNEVVVERMGSDIPATFPKDYTGNKTEDLPLMKGVKNYNNIDFVYNLSAGYPGTYEWVIFAVDPYKIKLAAGNTAVQAPLVYPYVQSGQLIGVLGGMKGGAEFEIATGKPAKAVKYMFSQSVTHAVICFFILIGNFAYFATRKKKGS